MHDADGDDDEDNDGDQRLSLTSNGVKLVCTQFRCHSEWPVKCKQCISHFLPPCLSPILTRLQELVNHLVKEAARHCFPLLLCENRIHSNLLQELQLCSSKSKCDFQKKKFYEKPACTKAALQGRDLSPTDKQREGKRRWHTWRNQTFELASQIYQFFEN